MRLTVAITCAAMLLTFNVRAAVYYWDPEATTATSTPTGTWDATSAQWATSSTLTATPVAWQDNVAACFCAGTSATGTFTVQLDTTINCAGIFNGSLNPPGCFVTIAGSGALNMAPTSAISTGGANGGTTTIAVPLIGTGSIVLENTKTLFLHGTNTYSGGTLLGYNSGGTVIAYSGTVNFNNGFAFGTGPIEMMAGSANYTLAAEGTAPITITNLFSPIVGTNINFLGNAAGLTLSGNWPLGAATPGIGCSGTGNLVTIAGIISGTGGINKYGASTLKLTAANTYTGVTTISNGSLTIGNGGSITSSSRIRIFPGANGSTLDVSANSAWTLGGNTTLLAAGTGTSTSTAAMIKGATPAGVVGFGSRPIILNFTPTGFVGDTTHPPLSITQGSLTLNNNSFTVTNAAATPLGAGTYRLIQVSSATINGSPNPIVSVVGTGLATNTTATLAIAGGQLNLIVKPKPAFTNFTVTQTVAVGTGVQSVTLSGRLNAGSVYPAINETININLNGAVAAAKVTNSTGDFAATFNVSSIPSLPTNYPVTLSYPGNASLAGTTNSATKIFANSFLNSSALAGFFGGYNMITTNDSGLNMFAWSSTNPCLPVASWSLEGQMTEQPLPDIQGQSRYTWTANPTDPNVTIYYIFGTTLNWPYASPTSAQWISVDESLNQNFYTTNTTISASGILSLPSPPIIVQQSTEQKAIAGKTVNLSAIATGTPTLSYEWHSNNVIVSDAVSSTLQLPNVTADQNGTYSVIVSNQYGTVTSAPMTLTVLPPPQITTRVSTEGLQLSATGVPSDPYVLQTTASLTPPINWITILTNNADANGLVQFTNGMTVGTNQFYRILCP